MTLISKPIGGQVASAESILEPVDKYKDASVSAAYNSVPINSSAKATVEFAAKAFPDLATIGNAFTLAISYINSQNYPDLEAEAQNWLTVTGRYVMERLKDELCKLHTDKNNPTRLPVYALDPQESLNIYTTVPYALFPYRDQFEDYLRQLLGACGLDAKTGSYTFAGEGKIKISIMFPNLLRDTRTSTIGNLVFFLAQ